MADELMRSSTRDGYGTMGIRRENYSRLADNALTTETEEQMMDKSDVLAEQSDFRLSGEEVFDSIRSKLNMMKSERQ